MNAVPPFVPGNAKKPEKKACSDLLFHRPAPNSTKLTASPGIQNGFFRRIFEVPEEIHTKPLPFRIAILFCCR